MKPSKIEYDKAKNNVKFLKESITLSKQKIMDLVNELSKENQNLIDYQRCLEESQKIVYIYDSYEEILMKI